MKDSEQKASTQDSRFMTITKFAWDEKALQVKALEAKVEEMQKTLEWYADEKNWGSIEEYGALVSDGGELARQALKGVETK